jgi:LmbE family N-acetylglucosaminyl deacetylase
MGNIKLGGTRIAAIFFAFSLFVTPMEVVAQSPRTVSDRPSSYAAPLTINRGAAGLWQTLKKLRTRASLIMFTAHPDDEDGGMLAYESRGAGARVVLFTLNRGEGGANIMSSDYFDALGLVRTEELLDADRYYGVQEYFSTVCDYGFSKSLQEAIQKWTVRRVLYDAVRVIRMTRPLIVTSVFVGGPSDGHGNHQMAGMVAQLAYKDAGNPNIFPDQIRSGLRPWTPLKDYAHVPFAAMITSKGIYDYSDHHYYPVRFRNYITNTWIQGQLTPDVEIPEGAVDPLLGISYAQIARQGLGYQKSQNGGTGAVAWNPTTSGYYRFDSRVQVKEKESSFFDGVDTSLSGIAGLAHGGDVSFLQRGLARINSLVEDAMDNFSAGHPEKIAPTLAEGLKTTNTLIAQVASSGLSDDAKYNVTFELKTKQAQFSTALIEALGLSGRATVAPEKPPTGMFARFFGTLSPSRVAVPGQKIAVSVHLANRGRDPVEVREVKLGAASGEPWPSTAEGTASGELAGATARNVRFLVHIPETAPLTKPYFSRPNIEQSYYNLQQSQYRDLPLMPYPLSAYVEFGYQGVNFGTHSVVQTAQRQTGPGLVLDPLVVEPAISVWISPRAGIVPLGTTSFTLHAVIHSNVDGPAQGTVHLELPSGWQGEPQHFAIAKPGEDEGLNFKVSPENLEEKSYEISAIADYDGKEYKQGYQTVGYAGLRPYFLYRPSAYRTTGVQVKVAPRLNIGYITGSGDDVPESLENLSLKVHFLTSEDLAAGDLSRYNVILIGVRAYAVRNDLITYNTRVLRYVKNGGVVIVQYQTPQYDHNYGPYPYKMTNDPPEVTDEDSKMVVLEPENPVFTWPNKITTKDFDGWIEERGSKFMVSWDSHYHALLETHDPDQVPQKGGLLYARYGKGIYIYNAYAFYRQLPEGVPGAYRLVANLVSLPDNPQANAFK